MVRIQQSFAICLVYIVASLLLSVTESLLMRYHLKSYDRKRLICQAILPDHIKVKCISQLTQKSLFLVICQKSPKSLKVHKWEKVWDHQKNFVISKICRSHLDSTETVWRVTLLWKSYGGIDMGIV